ncbi:hypothetical protein [Polaromonas glacialis]|uniref:hypothetical protein n=1 Tax=Polaromonas glacialis TaxID=866564 RepID=UPI0018DB606E|nr:hypothetical protein [Polaromonas glacialis]
MSSTRDYGLVNQPNPFLQNHANNCSEIAHIYRLALSYSTKYPPGTILIIPTCHMLALALEKLKGQQLPWTFCTNYPGAFDTNHMRSCLERFLPLRYGINRTLFTIKDCNDATEQYEIALQAAYITQSVNPTLPPSYQRPSCRSVDAIFLSKSDQITKEREDQNKEQLEHQRLEQTQESEAAAPEALKNIIEPPLPDTAPPSIVPPSPSPNPPQDRPKITEALSAPEDIRPQTVTRFKQTTDISEKSDKSGFFTPVLKFLGMNNPVTQWGAVIHGIFYGWFLLFSRQRIIQGQWLFFSRRFEKNFYLLHWVLGILGVWRTGFGWIGWALLAIFAGHGLRLVLQHFGAFDPPTMPAGATAQGNPPQQRSIDSSKKWI